MKCPICKTDLSPLDLVSRHEHVELCIENGPTVVDVSESGQLVMKKHVPPNKQRRICPICDKTFMTIHLHFKTCALKNDLPPQLMLEHWDKINTETQANKKFPRELLDSFIAKCVKEGRVGEQVEYAKALSLSMAEQEPDKPTLKRTKNRSVIQQQQQTNIIEIVTDEDTNQSIASTSSSIQQQVTRSDANDEGQQQKEQAQAHVVDVDQILMQSSSRDSFMDGKQATRPKTRLETADEATRIQNIELRMDRELAASRLRRYQEALKSASLQSSQEVPDFEPTQSSQEGSVFEPTQIYKELPSTSPTKSSQEHTLTSPTKSSQEQTLAAPTKSSQENTSTSPTKTSQERPVTPPTQSSLGLPLTPTPQSSQGSSILISE